MSSLDNASSNDCSKSSQVIADFLREFFVKLEAGDMSYVVLRNYEDLPDQVDNDVDFLVDKSEVKSFEAELEAVSSDFGFVLIRNMRRFRYVSYWYYHPELGCVLHVDIWTTINIKGISWLSESDILGSRVVYNGFWVPQNIDLVLMLLFKDLLQTGTFRDKYKTKIREYSSRNQSEFNIRVNKLLGNTMAAKVISFVAEDNWSGIGSISGGVRLSIISRVVMRKPFNSLYCFIGFVMCHFKALFTKSNGMFLVLVGPDGSGKSSVYSGVKSRLSSFFKPCKYYHGRFNIIPSLNDLIHGRVKAKKLSRPDFSIKENSDKAQVYGLCRSLAYILYYLFDYLLGYLVVARSNKKGGMIVFDRYFYDYMIQPEFKRVPNCLLKLLNRLLPNPDLILYLKCDPEIIYARKPELTIDCIKKQQEIIEKNLSSNTSFTSVDTSRSAEVVVSELENKIFSLLARRYGK